MARILITGGSRGIGRAMVAEGIKRGHQMIASVRRAEDAEHLPSGVETLQFDVTDHQSLLAAADELEGPIDVLVNNAGIIGPQRQSTLDMDFDGFAKTLEVNTIAPLAVTQAFLTHLRKSNSPKLVMISSQMGRLAYQKSDRIAYRASKAALNKVMQGLATDLLASGIAVQSLDPGWTRTDMGGPEADISAEESASGLLDRIEELTMARSGTFVNYAGKTIDW
ncbi:MAG: SDR family oxidoreductase [Pseudomonadota bacterium]